MVRGPLEACGKSGHWVEKLQSSSQGLVAPLQEGRHCVERDPTKGHSPSTRTATQKGRHDLAVSGWSHRDECGPGLGCVLSMSVGRVQGMSLQSEVDEEQVMKPKGMVPAVRTARAEPPTAKTSRVELPAVKTARAVGKKHCGPGDPWLERSL